ncbi:branched-chain amino acid ABC transporter permease [Salinibacterium sp. G-O1]|uniref:branched-chain amino acid ABC transporter permease n=1 Tax=Salinibacterium sp. G-O1 TaxID=3046208 RepID=UPI0024B8FC32|nr:branched-chain amino acid ABC transporter permease [Salinibacterium sp. G-O1]MDJ0335032.1 branched-chain amino acid ABC transporter permease [Salinibacterium sp. G-O1]
MDAFIQYTAQGLAAGGFYALAALGLAVIFGALNVVNFAHGAFYMLGAVLTAVLLDVAGINFWVALVLVPVILFGFGIIIERLLVQWLLGLDNLYSFLLTFGISLVLVDVIKIRYGVSGLPYGQPPGLEGLIRIGAVQLPVYQVFVFVFSVLVCLGVWLLLAKTRVGVIVRAATEEPERARALGINVGLWVTPVFGFGVALAGIAGVLAAPFRAITATMGSSFIIILFAIVVIGGLGSILGSVVAGFLVGLVEAYGQGYASTFSQIIIFVLMAVVILVRPAGLFGRKESA